MGARLATGIADAGAEPKHSTALATRLIARAFTGASLIFSDPTRPGVRRKQAGTCHNARKAGRVVVIQRCRLPLSSCCNRPCPILFSRSEEHTSELQSLRHLVCRLLL